MKLSYVVVAKVAQTDLAEVLSGNKRGIRFVETYTTTKDTNHIIQPSGRQIAQACHATAAMENSVLLDSSSLTRIVLQARDSMELVHVHRLLSKAGVKSYRFWDTNDNAYGEGKAVLTALATEPVTKQKVQGILDYLPLWF